MATRPNRSDPWKTCNADKFDFNKHAREMDAQNQFAPPDTPPAIGLRQFLDRETRAQAASAGSNTTLVPGKIYLKELQDGSLELWVSKGRSCWDTYPGETAEELLEFAKQHFIQEP